MSNKGLTTLIIFLLVLCGVTFGAFYLKSNPELALSQKIFGGADNQNLASNTNDDELNSPFGSNNPNGELMDNTVGGENIIEPIVIDGTNLIPQGGANDTIISNNTSSVQTDTTNSVVTPDTTTTTTNTTTTTTSSSNTTTTKASITQTLKKGSSGAQVKILQQFLIDSGYLTGKADGAFGAMTETAVKKFQTEYNLTADGIVGGNTRSTINELLAA